MPPNYEFNLRWHSSAGGSTDLTKPISSIPDAGPKEGSANNPFLSVSFIITSESTGRRPANVTNDGDEIVTIDLPERAGQVRTIARANLFVDQIGHLSNVYRPGVKAALVVAWNHTEAEVLCPFRCAARRHKHDYNLPTGGVWHEILRSCPDDKSHCRFRLVFPFEDYIAEYFGWILSGSPLHFVTVPWDYLGKGRKNNAREKTRTPNDDDIAADLGGLSIGDSDEMASPALIRLQYEITKMREREHPVLPRTLHVDPTTFNKSEIEGAIVHRMLETAFFYESSKTIGCLYRGTTMPCEFAVSGWSRNHTEFVNERKTWTEAPMYSSARADYELKAETFCDGVRAGSFWACHVEKQLLSRFLWSHSTFFSNSADMKALGCCSPPDLGGLPIDIYVCRPYKQDTVVCDDCRDYCEREAERWKLTLRLFTVKSKKVHLYRSWKRGVC